MKKILIVINNLGVGGAERLVIDECNEIVSRKDVRLKLITLKREGKNSLAEQLDKNVEWIQLDFSRLFDIFSLSHLYKEIRLFSPDLLATHLWFANTTGRIAGKAAGVRKIISFEHNVYDTLKTWKMFLVDFLLQSFSYKIVAVSRAVRASLIRHRISGGRIDVLLNGINILKYENIQSSSLDGEKKNDFTFLFVGRLIYQKGVDVLLDAFSQLDGGRLLIVGDGAEKAKLMKISEELQIANRVEFLGTRHDIPLLLSYSDCFVLPSRYEGLPMVLLEAVAAQKVIIVSAFDSAAEIITNGINGIVVEKENSQQLKTAMSQVMNNREMQLRLKKNIADYSQRISIRNHAEALLQYAN